MYIGYFSKLYNMGGENIEDENDDKNQCLNREGFDHLYIYFLLFFF